MSRLKLCPAIALTLALIATSTSAQVSYDPIGPLTRVTSYDRAHGVELGSTERGRPACYVTEKGSTYTLDIGMTDQGAFIRLATSDRRETTPKEPLRLFAGKQIPAGEYGAGLFDEILPYDGEFAYFVPKRDNDGFVVIASGDPHGFLAMVARARNQYVVVQSKLNPKLVNYVAIYAFTESLIPLIMGCARG